MQRISFFAKRIVACSLATALLVACERQENKRDGTSENPVGVTSENSAEEVSSPSSTTTSNQGEPVADAPAPTTPPSRPPLGPVSTSASFEVAEGGRLDGDEYVQTHFNLISGHLHADFAPGQITFALASEGVDGTYPSVDLLVYKPGDTEWSTLRQGLQVEGQVKESFPLENAAPGRYAFRIRYGAVEPAADARPVLVIKSIALSAR